MSKLLHFYINTVATYKTGNQHVTIQRRGGIYQVITNLNSSKDMVLLETGNIYSAVHCYQRAVGNMLQYVNAVK